jgi:hypothetical protein
VIAIGPNQDDAITATTTLLPDLFILRRIHPHHPNRLASIAATASIPWTGKEFYSLSRPQAAVERPRRSRRPRRAGGCAALIDSARARRRGRPLPHGGERAGSRKSVGSHGRMTGRSTLAGELRLKSNLFEFEPVGQRGNALWRGERGWKSVEI